MIKSLPLAAVVSSLLLAAAPLGAEELHQPLAASKAVDLTQKMHEGMAFWPGGVPFTMERLVTYEQVSRATCCTSSMWVRTPVRTSMRRPISSKAIYR